MHVAANTVDIPPLLYNINSQTVAAYLALCNYASVLHAHIICMYIACMDAACKLPLAMGWNVSVTAAACVQHNTHTIAPTANVSIT